MDTKAYIKKSSKIIYPAQKRWINYFLKNIPLKGSIIEIGSGTGYDASYMENKGFSVIRTDVYKDFIDYQKNKYKKLVHYLDVVSGKIDESINAKYDGLYAFCVFHLLSPYGINKSFRNIRKLLKYKGIFAFNVMLEWSKNDIENFLKKHSFEPISITKDKTWYYIICQKSRI